MFFVLLFMHPAYAKGNVTQINSQEEFMNWYNDPLSESCILNQDIVIDDYFYDHNTNDWDDEFEQTNISKTVYTVDYSLIFKVSYDFCNDSFHIIGSGQKQPVLQLNGEKTQSTIYSLFVEATDGNALSIGEDQKINVIMDINIEFPIQLKAKNYALMNYGDAKFLTTQFLTESHNAIFTADNAYTELKCCEINKQENPDSDEKHLYMEDTYVGSQLVNDYGCIDYEEIDAFLYVKSMKDFNKKGLPQMNGSYAWNDFLIKVDWDLSKFDVNQKENILIGKIVMNPLFHYLIDISEISITIVEKEPQPLTDFDIELQDWNIGTFRPWMVVTYPKGHEEVYLEVYRSEELLYRSYDITEEIEDYYYSGNDVYFMVPAFSEIAADEVYYCCLKVIGGLYEGKSNFVKVHNGIIEYVSPFPTEQTPPSHENKPNEDNVESDSEDPNDTVDGSGGHRGDQNRTDDVDEDHKMIMQPEQIEGLSKTQEDVILIVDSQQLTIPHSVIKEWHQSEKEVTVNIENNQATYQIGDGEAQKLDTTIIQKEPVYKSSQLGSYRVIKTFMIIFVGIICGGLYYMRKKRYDK